MRAHLIGGGPSAMKAMRQHAHEALLGLGNKPLVAYIGVASGDDASFLRRMSDMFSGARVELAKLARPKDSAPEALQLLADADAIFFSGGDVDLGMKTLRDRGMVDPIRTFAAAGKRIIGLSAGSILVGQHWVRFHDDDYLKAERFDCLGLVPLSFDAHGEDDEWAELCHFVRVSAAGGDPTIGYGLPAKGALVVNDDLGLHLTPRGEATVRVGIEHGIVTWLTPLEPSSL